MGTVAALLRVNLLMNELKRTTHPLGLRTIMNEALPRITHLPSERSNCSLKFTFIYYRNICKCAVGLSLKLQNVDYRLLIRF
jgi:hypothetical protein